MYKDLVHMAKEEMRDFFLHVVGRDWKIELGKSDNAFQISGFPSLPCYVCDLFGWVFFGLESAIAKYKSITTWPE